MERLTYKSKQPNLDREMPVRTGETDDKQPRLSHAKDEELLYMAAITAWQPGKNEDVEHGFAIATVASAGGIVDIHDRRPVVLTPEAAPERTSSDTSVESALELLSSPRFESAFK
ncbi:hypothetical protein ALFP_1645 [Alcaligenes faecalis]|uniref:SOS response-associated peptidase family protein n=1 Tax=Alcaligenes faecalis TaxID=511 RepID=UPI0007C55AF7|nr:SOS response-associated peptidase family protein [Alcaligenes faecalis]ARP53532.1 hypothetical protein ALFP_1645 [Alcaligenes faecalis]